MEAMLEQFQHLLQPMRDLEQNWSVDLAEELTQAFTLLSEHCIAFGHHGDEILDFGKAALIIQGGAQVYSKKVDYLYKSVHELKEWMEKLWEEEKKRKKRGDTRAADDEVVNEENDLNLSEVDLDKLEDPTVLADEQQVDQIMGSVLLPSRPIAYSTDTLTLKIPLQSCKGDVIAYLNELSDIDTRQIWTDVPEVQPATDEMECHDNPVESCPNNENPNIDDPVTDSANEDDAYNDDTLISENAVGKPSQTFPVTPLAPEPRMGENLRPRRNLIALPERQEEVDPWTELLDPYEMRTRKSKPLKPGNCKRPNSQRRGRKRTKDGQAATMNATDIVTFCRKEFGPQLGSFAGSSELFDTVREVFAPQLRERQRRIKALMACRAKEYGEYIGDEEFGGEDGAGNLDQGEDNSDLEPDDHPPINIDNLEIACGDEALPTVYSDYISNALNRRIDDLADNNKLSELDRRVRLWETSVRSALDEADSRPPFDMRHYSSLIFSSFARENETIAFESVLQGKPKHEAFRTFVSALILANNGNVEIQHAGPENHCFKLKLLDRSTLNEKIGEEFRPTH